MEVDLELDRVETDKSDTWAASLEVKLRVRFSRTQTTERDYVIVMVGLGLGSQGDCEKVCQWSRRSRTMF